jgi:uncharacterized protein (TIGR02996 family)
MNEAEALLQAIAENPDEDTPRLVYADWLDEHGQPERAEFIRVQIEIASQDDDKTDEAKRLGHRENALLEAHRKEWTAHLEPFNGDVQFARGFPEFVHAHIGVKTGFDFLHRLPGLRHLSVRTEINPDALRTIASFQNLDLIEIWSAFQPSWLEFLEPLPCWTYTYIPKLHDNAFEEWEEFQERRISKVVNLSPDQQRLAAARFACGLKRHTDYNKYVRATLPVKSVRFWKTQTTDAEFRLLSYLPELEEIDIHLCRESVAGLRHLSGLPNLKKFEISDTLCDSLVPIMDCTTLEHLEYHSLGGAFGDESVVGLERLKNLRHLVLCPSAWPTGLRNATIHRIGTLRELRHLWIEFGTRNDRAAVLDSILHDEQSRSALSNLTKLEFLSLNDDEYTGAELKRFLESLR